MWLCLSSLAMSGMTSEVQPHGELGVKAAWGECAVLFLCLCFEWWGECVWLCLSSLALSDLTSEVQLHGELGVKAAWGE